MQHHSGRPHGLWHIGVWLAAAGFATPVLAAPIGDKLVSSEPAISEVTADETNGLHTTVFAEAARPVAGTAWPPVDDTALDAARGGFTSNGLTVSLGIERLVSINGDVVARTHIDIADLSRIGGEQARQTSEALSSVKLIQNGGANIYRSADSGASMAGVVIQNSLNNQLIRTDTVINSTVNSAGLLNTLNFHSTLQDALNRATGQR